MSIPTEADDKLAEIENLHAVAMIKLRVWRHTPEQTRDPEAARAALQAYLDRAIEFLNTA